MDDIRQLLDSARRRLMQDRALRGLHYGCVGAAILVLLVILLTKTSPTVAASLPLSWVIGCAAAAALVTAAVVMRGLSLSPMTIAVLIDERLGLKERLSTALAVKDRSDGFARAAVADAVTTAKDPRTREALGRSFPVRAPNTSWISPLIAAAAVGAWFIPQGDLFTATASQQEVAKAKNEVKVAETEVRKILEKNEKLKELGKKLGDVTGENTAPEELPKTPEEVRQDALKKLTEAQKKLNDVMKGEDAQKLDALKSQLANLDAPQDKETSELSKALKDGDFKAAQEALDKLKAAAEKDPAKKAEIEKQLGDLSKQIEKLAENKSGLESALKKANLDPKLAGNKEALERALESAKNLSEQQKQDIRKAAESQRKAAEKMQELSKACNGAANKSGSEKAGSKSGGSQSGAPKDGPKDGQQGSEGSKSGEKKESGGKGDQGGQKSGEQSGSQQASTGSMSDQLNELEAMDQMLKDAQAAMNECDKQSDSLGQCMGEMPGQCNNPSNGNNIGNKRGGHGRANGGSAGFQKTPTATKLQKEKVELTAGEIISRQAVEGQSERGDSSVPLNKIISDVAKSMEQGVTEEEVPQHLRELHKIYFGDLKNKLEAARDGKPAPAAPATPAAPAGDAAKPAPAKSN